MLASEFISSILQLAASLAVKHLSLLISEEFSSMVNAQLFVKNCARHVNSDILPACG